MQRVMAYVDGFNLYFGLKDSSFKRYYWLDVSALAQSLLKPGQQLLATHYFTARIRANGRNSADQKRQTAAERERLFKIIEDLVQWENTNNEEVLERARAEIRRSWRETCELNKNHPQAASSSIRTSCRRKLPRQVDTVKVEFPAAC